METILIYGFPSTGKTYLVNEVLEPEGYSVLDSDCFFDNAVRLAYLAGEKEGTAHFHAAVSRYITEYMSTTDVSNFDVVISNIWSIFGKKGLGVPHIAAGRTVDDVVAILTERGSKVNPEVIRSWGEGISELEDHIGVKLTYLPIGKYLTDLWYDFVNDRSVSRKAWASTVRGMGLFRTIR